jgi:hypothetical protein
MTMQEPFTIEYGIDRDGERYWRITIPHGRNWNEQYYALGHEPPNFPVPAIPQSVEYVFIGGLMDGIFIREHGWIVAGAYLDGLPVD